MTYVPPLSDADLPTQNLDRICKYETKFQVDSPLHTGVNVRIFVEEGFNKRCTIEWASRSADLTPFFF